MTRPRPRALGYTQIVLATVALLAGGAGAAAGCSGATGGDTSNAGSGGTGGKGGAGGTTSTVTTGGIGGGIGGGFGGGIGGNVGCDEGAPDKDDDGDGYSEAQGDCNDCDPNANPGAAEVIAEKVNPDDPEPEKADEDCDMLIDEMDPDLKPCDDGLALDSTDPMDAVKAIGLCDVDDAGNPRFINKATWVLADGLPPGPSVDMAKYHLGHGLLDHLGLNDVPREGKRMLALSSGTARNKNEPGFVARNYDKGYSSNPPLTFNGESTDCPGVVVPKSSVQDAAGLELELQVPSNAISLEFAFNFRSYEFPQFICTQFNDFFWANLVQGNTNKNISFDQNMNPISVNAAFLSQCDCPPAGPGMCTVPPFPMAGQPTRTVDCQGTDLLDGSDFDGTTNPKPTYNGWTNGGTGWLKTTTPVTPSQVLKLRFVVFDSGVVNGVKDHNVDSTVTIDRFRWHAIPAKNETIPE